MILSAPDVVHMLPDHTFEGEVEASDPNGDLVVGIVSDFGPTYVVDEATLTETAPGHWDLTIHTSWEASMFDYATVTLRFSDGEAYRYYTIDVVIQP